MTEIDLDDMAEKARKYLDDAELKPRDFKAIADLILHIYELKMKHEGANKEDLATLLEKIPEKHAKKFRKLWKKRRDDYNYPDYGGGAEVAYTC